MLKFIVIVLVLIGAFFTAGLLWPGVWATAFTLGTVHIPWMALVLVLAVIIALKAK